MTREEKILEARRLKAEGLSSTDIGRKLSVSPSTIRNWYLGGRCCDCGTPIQRSDHGYPAKRCSRCQHVWEAASKKWTREAVLDAIQRWACEHGRPPSARDWLHSDQANQYPARTSVYRSHTGSSSEFATWADAIAAAGFPRPRTGVYVHTPEIRTRQKEAQLRRRKRERQAA